MDFGCKWCNRTYEVYREAYDLVSKGEVQPSGYTEPILHKQRLELKIKL